ncbi:ATPase involved in DNA repair domain protein [Burkholderia cenocepacia]|uniref:hypothetical protein n=1 Tax=Burkholderia latens TaxID=488446 RepID=UPI0004F8DA1F|nr:hypothetical protein [Burkholderia latens]AIO40417.1 ATPase involved in DNA repair domain protein [Burkholderia cenocepacia]MBR7961270.1 hypothetical protein [Burkholderia vietnamiensis]
MTDALAPNGIPADLLRKALTRLTAPTELSEWADVTITAVMEILSNGRAYALLYDSER